MSAACRRPGRRHAHRDPGTAGDVGDGARWHRRDDQPGPGNCYFRDGAAGLLDWQAVRRGHPARDLAYTLITSMTTAERRASERELVGTYRAALVAAGGPELDRGQLWERYRQAAAYAYVAALATAGLGGMQAENIALEGLQRSVAALGDLDTVARLQQAL
ncbi:DUF1679 domain-containing protein [Mycobacterium eburneum]|nr:DUF1679 domain-containing protein [Mycobacterium eburneum]